MTQPSTSSPKRSNDEWLADLQSSADAERSQSAQGDLAALLRAAIAKATAARQLDDATLDDLTQVAQVHVLDNLERFEGRSKFTTWAYSVAVRAALSELRRPGSRPSAAPLSEEQASAVPSEAPEPEALAERTEIVEILHRIIAEELTERQRTAILGELGGTPKEQLIEQLGINRNALYKLVHDARQKLKQGLADAGICDHQVREAFDL